MSPRDIESLRRAARRMAAKYSLDAEDLLQQTLLVLLRKKPENPVAFGLGVMRFEATAMLRRRDADRRMYNQLSLCTQVVESRQGPYRFSREKKPEKPEKPRRERGPLLPRCELGHRGGCKTYAMHGIKHMRFCGDRGRQTQKQKRAAGEGFVLELLYVGASYTEIRDALGTPRTTIRNIAARAPSWLLHAESDRKPLQFKRLTHGAQRQAPASEPTMPR